MGKIRFYGISSIRPNVIRRFVEHSNIQTVMLQYSLLDRRPEEAMLSFLKKNNVSVLARGILAQGLLAKKPPIDYLDYTKEEVRKLQTFLQGPGNSKWKCTILALKYVLSNTVVASAVTGLRTGEQLKEILAANASTIPASLLQKVSEILTPKKYTSHR